MQKFDRNSLTFEEECEYYFALGYNEFAPDVDKSIFINNFYQVGYYQAWEDWLYNNYRQDIRRILDNHLSGVGAMKAIRQAFNIPLVNSRNLFHRVR